MATLTEAAEALYSRVGYEPWPTQREVLSCEARQILLVGGEQGGKSLVASKHLLRKFPEDLNRVGEGESLLYWLVAADYERTRAEFEYLVEDFTKLFGVGVVRASKRIDPGSIEIWLPGENKPKIQIPTKSARDPRTLAMRAPHGIIACEASQLDLGTYHKLRARAAPKRAWLFLSGTFEGALGWYPMLAKAWVSGQEDRKSFRMAAYENLTLYPGGRNDPEILALERDSSDDFFLERIEGIPCPPMGVVFHEFRPDIHIKDVEYVPDVPVHLWIDPGYAEACAVEAVQLIDGQVRVFDEVYEQGLGVESIIDIVKHRKWWQDVNFGVVDIYGYQHHGVETVVEAWLREAGLVLSAQKVAVNDGSERLRGYLKPDPLFHEPKIVFSLKCEGVLSEFGAMPNPIDGETKVYRWKTDRDGNIIGSVPDDRYNHGIKALIYGLVDNYGYGYIANRDRIHVKRW